MSNRASPVREKSTLGDGVTFAIPVKANSRDLQTGTRAVGLTRQAPESSVRELTELLEGICEEIIHLLQ